MENDTTEEVIEGGIPFYNEELNNKGNNVNSNYQSSRYTVVINENQISITDSVLSTGLVIFCVNTKLTFIFC